MKEKTNIEKYIEEQELEKQELEKKFNDFVSSIDKEEFNERKKRLEYFVFEEKQKQILFARYNNFIMDIRKPSFWVFCIFVIWFIIDLIMLLWRVVLAIVW